jgi:hypothetical protein
VINKGRKITSKAQKKADEVVKAYVSKSTLKTDPLGSYTGNSKDKFEKPDQDGDDL